MSRPAWLRRVGLGIYTVDQAKAAYLDDKIDADELERYVAEILSYQEQEPAESA